LRDPICDVQFSCYLDKFVYIVLLHEFVFFHVDSQALSPTITPGQTSVQYRQLIQSQDNHKLLLGVQRSVRVDSEPPGSRNHASICKPAVRSRVLSSF
jgi:hypothetical protein